jgi:predicted nucleic acid-binding protein
VQLYFDTSALVKLVTAEPESAPLRSYLSETGGDAEFTAAITRTELVRAAARLRDADIARQATLLLTRLQFVEISRALLDAAAALPPPELRALDAIHLAAAMTAPDLRALVTYDRRLADAAAHAGLSVASPA